MRRIALITLALLASCSKSSTSPIVTEMCACRTHACADAVFAKAEEAGSKLSESEVNKISSCLSANLPKAKPLASFAPAFDRQAARASLKGTWKVRYRFAEHEWAINGDDIVIDGTQKATFSAADDELSDVVHVTTKDGFELNILVLYAGDSFFATNVSGPYGIASNGHHVVTIGFTVLELEGETCTQFEFDGNTADGFMAEGTPANCRITKEGDETHFVFENVGSDEKSGSLIVTAGAIVNEGLMNDRASRVE